MKKLISLILSLCLLIGVMPVMNVMAEEATNREDINDLARAIYSRLDNVGDNEVLKQGYEAYLAGDAALSLKLFRNSFVERLRSARKSYYSGYDLKDIGYQKDVADMVVGKMTVEEWHNIGYSGKIPDLLNAFFSPNLNRKIDWLAGMDAPLGTSYSGDGQEAFLSWIGGLPLVYYYTYSKTGKIDDIYERKFMQVISDFSVNQKRVTDEYMKIDVRPNLGAYDQRFWTYNWHANTQRNSFIINGLTQLAKLLPAEGETKMPDLKGNWDNIVPPFEKANPDYYDEIDEVIIAQYAVHVFEDVAPFVAKGLTANYATNMKEANRNLGAQLLGIYSEFDLGDALEEGVPRELLKTWQSIYEDGAMLEASFNYNNDVYKGWRGLIEFYDSIGVEEDWMREYKYISTLYERMKEGYRGSNFVQPKIGNGGTKLNEIPPIWKDDKALENWKKQNNYTYDKNPPKYTSIYYPWGGYTTLKTGWDIKDDISLSFYSSETYGKGHTSLIQNSIWIDAFGRNLLNAGDGGPYNPEYYDEEFRDEYDSFNDYFGETKSRKGVTVVVENSDQVVGTKSTDATEKKPASSRFGTSEHFDYIDGNYYLGYTGSLGRITNINHNRQNILVRDAGLFIITDTMENDYGTSLKYSQIWRFPFEFINKKGVQTAYGFKEDEVVIDEEKREIKTQDPGEVNLFMNQFSNSELSYTKYYGSKGENGDGIYRGWGVFGITGAFMPAPDVYVRWNDEGDNKKTQIVTMAMPSKTDEVPYESIEEKNNPEKGISGFELVTKDDLVVISQNAAIPTELIAEGITAKAKNLVVTKKGTQIRGVIMDCEALTYNDVKMNLETPSFEFAIEDGKLVVKNVIDKKTAFGWVEEDDGYYPTYECYDRITTTNISNTIKNNIKLLSPLWYRDHAFLISKFRDDFELYAKNINEFDNITFTSSKTTMQIDICKYIDRVNEMTEYYERKEFSDKAVKELETFKTALEPIDLSVAADDRLVDEIEEKLNSTIALISSAEYNKEEIPPVQEVKGFTDIEKSWAKEDILALYDKGLVKGMTDTTFGPDLSMTRAEFVTLLLRVLNIPEKEYTNSFSDVKTGDWYASSIQSAFDEGLVNGKGDGFSPNDKIKREEAAKIIALAIKTGTDVVDLDFTDNDKISDWAKEYINMVKQIGLISGYPDGTFGPQKNITRAESVVIFKRLLEFYEKINEL